MGRLKPHSVIVEIPPYNYSMLTTLLEFLVEKGVSSVDILLEPTLVSTRLLEDVVLVAVLSPSIVVEGVDPGVLSELCKDMCRVYTVLRDTWASLARVSTTSALELLRTVLGFEERHVTEGIRVEFFDGSPCPSPVIVETLAVKHPVSVYMHNQILWFSEKVSKVAKLIRGVPLVICAVEEPYVIATMESSNGERVLHFKKPGCDAEYYAYVQVALDALAYVSMRSRR